MEKIVKYEMNEQEHEELENTLALMDEAIRKEIQRLHLIANVKRTDSDIICLNTYEYLRGMMYDVRRKL